MSIRAAAAKFDIPYPTLCKHIIKGSATKLLGRFRRTFSNDQESELVCILDRSAAFDTVDHHIFCLTVYSQHSLFVDQSSTAWIQSFCSFITNRSQTVSFAGDVSTQSVVTCGVPQGSVLGPIIFLLYTADVTNIALRCGLNVHSYADDTHLYVHCDAVNCAAEAARLAACMEELLAGHYPTLALSQNATIWDCKMAFNLHVVESVSDDYNFQFIIIYIVTGFMDPNVPTYSQ